MVARGQPERGRARRAAGHRVRARHVAHRAGGAGGAVVRHAAVARRAGGAVRPGSAGAARQPEAAAHALRRRRHLRARHPAARRRADRQRGAAAQARPRARRGRTRAGTGARPLAEGPGGARRRAQRDADAARQRRARGLAADLLLRRPTWQAAEARLRAAGARVDAARAAYFPGITLTAALRLSRARSCPPVRGRASLAWSLGGRADAADLGRRAHRRAVRRHAGAPQQVELDYRDSVGGRFKEMRDALGAYSEAKLTLQSAQRRSQALVRAAELTRIRYDGGQSSRLDVIDADRLALTAQAQSADAARALTEAQANVFRALGGGWQVRRRADSVVMPGYDPASILPAHHRGCRVKPGMTVPQRTPPARRRRTGSRRRARS